ncbi:DUF1295 domain-containing protein [Allohahella marinimesophila]|uniref:DUF1295 domain-containing protein n=1 Tax=Allohahella marinimesophila TaxID=1054972 RepID=A0ABP7PDD4_9GAMM
MSIVEDYTALWVIPLLMLPIFLIGWLVQLKKKNASWVDVIWALGVAVCGGLAAVLGGGDPALRMLIGAIYLVWFGRLGWHLLTRVAGDEHEDGRYAHMRDWAGAKAPWLFLLFYIMQASWVSIFTLPAVVVANGALPPFWALIVGLLIIVIAWVGESLADRQLAAFKRESGNSGKTCRKGLWRYSRHPNYFFEWLQWFGYPLLGLQAAYGDLLWLAPLIVFVFLYYVTGIPFTERQAIRSRGDDYRQYQRTTSMFFPWRPKT